VGVLLERYFNYMRSTAIVAAVLVCTLAFSASRPSVYADKITKINNIKSSSAVKYKAPTNSPEIISVSSDENLSEIAATYNTTVARLFDANLNIVNPDLIYPNEKLVIPNANETLQTRPMPSGSSVASDSTSVDNSAVSTAAVTEVPSSNATNSSSDSVWNELAECESGGDWSIDSGNGFYGGLQFTLASWQAVGGVGYPNQASEAQQIAAAEQLQSTQGWSAWPVCSAELGL
jgi:LysM repeat protein